MLLLEEEEAELEKLCKEFWLCEARGFSWGGNIAAEQEEMGKGRE